LSAHTGKMSIVAHGGSTSFMYTVGYYQLVLFLLSTHAHIHFSTLVFRQRGVSHLAILDPSSLTLSTVKTAFTDIYGLFAKGNNIYLTGGSAVDALSLAKISLTEGGKATSEESIIWSSLGLDTAQYKPYFSTPKVIEFPTKVAGQTAFANFYPPSNGDFDGPNGEKPPLLVRSHGTSELSVALQSFDLYRTCICDGGFVTIAGYCLE
jgi:hypothetical protein